MTHIRHVKVWQEQMCCSCHVMKPKENFWKSSKRLSGLAARCKECHKKKYHSGEKALFRYAKQRAKDKNIEFSIQLEDILIPKLCPILGINLIQRSVEGIYNAPSLDRIDNSKGYTKDNIHVISWRANTLKSNSTPREIELLHNWYKYN